VNLTETQISTL
jgi:DNA polymerase III delta prime subunit